jgi:hypothetical protein
MIGRKLYWLGVRNHAIARIEQATSVNLPPHNPGDIPYRSKSIPPNVMVRSSDVLIPSGPEGRLPGAGASRES